VYESIESVGYKDFSVLSIVVLHGDMRSRMFAKYWSARLKSVSVQTELEARLPKSANTEDCDITVIDQYTVLSKACPDSTCIFHIIGSERANELMLAEVLDCLIDSLKLLLGNSFGKDAIYDNLELLLLAVDEMFENGNILSIEPKVVRNRVLMTSSDDVGGETSVGDLTISEAIEKARENARESMKTVSAGGFLGKMFQRSTSSPTSNEGEG